MARQLRFEYAGAFYHVTYRGNQKGEIFWEDRDRKEFKKILERTKERRKKTGRERQFAIYLSKLFGGEKNSEVGRVFGISIQAVTNVLRRMKKVLEKDAESNGDMKSIKNILEKQNV